jgi:uncharacterized protein YdcH (DUF465 family)
MQLEHHDLHSEFPEHKDRIHELKTTDAHFGKLFSEYDVLDHKVRNLEEGGLLISDKEMEAFKLDRVRLKDELYAYLIKPS